ncbi:MAG: hypothetical protein Kow0069_01640 [Promethearchaeota archaeon]
MTITKVVLPKLGWTMEKGTVVGWFAQEGDAVEKGKDLFEVDTDKVTIAVESPASGVLMKVLAPAGSEVPVNDVIALIGDGDEDLEPVLREVEEARKVIASRGASGLGVTTGPAPPAPSKGSGMVLPPAATGAPTGRVFASPRARRRAAELGIDVRQVPGSFHGKVVEEDVLRYAARAAARPVAALAPPVSLHPSLTVEKSLPMEGIRKVIAERMYYSLQSSAQLTNATEVDMSAATRFRRKYNQSRGTRASFTAIIALVTSEVLKVFPEFNASISPDGTTVHYVKDVNLGIATATERGLMVPVIRDVPSLDLRRIADAIRRNAALARKNAIPLDDLSGGTFTISNLGTYDVEIFTPVINPPEVALLGMGRIVDKPVVVGGGIQVRPMMYLSLTYDHRLIDGHRAAQFAQAVKGYLEDEEALEKLALSREFEVTRPEVVASAAEEYDATFVVVGCGSGGQAAAERAAKLGAKVVVVESDLLGGKCLNWGCIPTKTYARTLEALAKARHAVKRKFGVVLEGAGVDYKQMKARTDKLVAGVRQSLERAFSSMGIELVRGHGVVVGPHEVRVGERVIRAKHVILDTGARYAPLASVGEDGRLGVMSVRQFLALQEIPREVHLFGNDYVAVELALICLQLGSSVTLITNQNRLMPSFDQEVVGFFARKYMRKVRTFTGVTDLVVKEGRLEFTHDGRRVEEPFSALVNLGRLVPNLSGVQLELDARDGFISVNQFLQTSVPSVYAVGDVNAVPLKLSHKASHEGRRAVEHALGKRVGMNYDSVPRALFYRPSVASVGKTEDELKAEGTPHAVLRVPFSSNMMAQVEGHLQGLVKVLYHPRDLRLLGVHVLGPEAHELANTFASLMAVGAKLDQLREVVALHPTYGELLGGCLPD